LVSSSRHVRYANGKESLVNDIEQAVKFISKFEGFSAEPYLDSGGIATIGFGSIWRLNGTRVHISDKPISFERATVLLTRQIRYFERKIEELVVVPLNENQRTALTSICFNIGGGNFQSSTFRQKLNRGDYVGCANNFWQWRRAGGKIVKGLVRRREAERLLFLDSDGGYRK